jgi:hypothetical protein
VSTAGCGVFVASDPPADRWRSLAGGGALWALSFGILLLRLPSAVHVLFAEDGTIFWLQASQGSPRLTDPYNGYMHAVPRLLGAAAQALPIGWAPVVMGAGSAAIAAALAVLIFHTARAHLPGTLPRLAIVAVLILSPVAGAEGVDNAANLQWYCLAAAFWLLLWCPRRSGAVTGAALMVVACTTSVLTVLLAPLALLRLVCVRCWRDRLIPLGFAVGAAIQLLVMSTTSRPLPAAKPTPGQLAVGYLVRIVTAGLAGPARATELIAHGAVPVVLIAAALAAAGMSAGLLSARMRPLTITALVASVWLYVAGAWIQWKVPDWGYQRGLPLQIGGRYHIVPMFLLWVAVISGLTAGIRRAPIPRWPNAPFVLTAVAAATVFTAGAVTQFQDGERSRSRITAWSTALADARSACAAGAREVTLPIAPAGWTVSPVPCERLQR